MSSNNNKEDNSGLIMVAAVFLAMSFLIFIAIYIACVFISLALSAICIFAWARTIVIGPMVFTPEASRAFVYRGLIGAVGLPAFLFLLTLSGISFRWDIWQHYVLAGYAGGSLGIEMLKAHYGWEDPAAPKETPIQRPADYPHLPHQRSESKPFRFASWDDEENGR